MQFGRTNNTGLLHLVQWQLKFKVACVKKFR
jgi:hypothetical protein